MEREKIIIMGAAGRDFHTFNVLFRDNPAYDVVAFTATQIPFIADKTYPKELSGRLYPKGIKIYDEAQLPQLIKKQKGPVVCILAYSDLSYQTVMEKASWVNAAGGDFTMLAPQDSMLKSSKPVIAVCAVRTGSGKSPTSRYIMRLLRKLGIKTVAIRHPMPYGDLKEQIVERFATLKDLDRYKATIEEREDYEPHIRNGFVVYAGVDYGRILRQAEKEADVIIWDGGNNDASFIEPDLLITVADPLRAGNELTYYPGEMVARMADVFLINKADTATKAEVERVRRDLKQLNPKAKVVLSDSPVTVDNERILKGSRALIVEDGPTITHGGMRIGAGSVAAKKYGVRSVVEAKKYAVGTLKETFSKYPALDKELPAMGYSPKQVHDLEAVINRADCDVVLSATPTNLRSIINANKPIVQVSYEIRPHGKEFDSIIERFISDRVKKRGMGS